MEGKIHISEAFKEQAKLAMGRSTSKVIRKIDPDVKTRFNRYTLLSRNDVKEYVAKRDNKKPKKAIYPPNYIQAAEDDNVDRKDDHPNDPDKKGSEDDDLQSTNENHSLKEEESSSSAEDDYPTSNEKALADQLSRLQEEMEEMKSKLRQTSTVGEEQQRLTNNTTQLVTVHNDLTFPELITVSSLKAYQKEVEVLCTKLPNKPLVASLPPTARSYISLYTESIRAPSWLRASWKELTLDTLLEYLIPMAPDQDAHHRRFVSETETDHKIRNGLKLALDKVAEFDMSCHELLMAYRTDPKLTPAEELAKIKTLTQNIHWEGNQSATKALRDELQLQQGTVKSIPDFVAYVRNIVYQLVEAKDLLTKYRLLPNGGGSDKNQAASASHTGKTATNAHKSHKRPRTNDTSTKSSAKPPPGAKPCTTCGK
jgi:hypothetical protein